MKKSLIICLGVVVLALGATAGVLWLNRTDQSDDLTDGESLIGKVSKPVGLPGAIERPLDPQSGLPTESSPSGDPSSPSSQFTPSPTALPPASSSAKPPAALTSDSRTAEKPEPTPPAEVWQISTEGGPAPGSPASGQPGLTGSSGGIPVPTGARAPTAFYDNAERTEPQQRALARIQKKFFDAVSQPGQGLTEEEAWAKAKEQADREYIKIFGFSQYEELNKRTALDAKNEKKAAGLLPPPAVTRDE